MLFLRFLFRMKNFFKEGKSHERDEMDDNKVYVAKSKY